MIETSNIKVHKDWKIVKKIRINKKLEKEIEEILDKHVCGKDENRNNSYPSERKTIFRKNR
jgi:hypothetical protein